MKKEKKKKLFNRKHKKHVSLSGEEYNRPKTEVKNDPMKADIKEPLYSSPQEEELLTFITARKMYETFGVRMWHVPLFRKYEPELLIGTEWENWQPKPKKRRLRRD